jgi:LPXTG-motif cell wall-anchored protein
VLLPKSMQFTGLSRSFAQDPDEAGMAVYFAKNVPAHEQVRFSVTGEGAAPREAQAGEATGEPAQAAPAGQTGSSSSAIWYVLAGMIIIVIGGAFWLWRRSAAVANPRASGAAAASAGKTQAGRLRRPSPEAAPAQDGMLEALKDELFQLETDRLNGKVSDEDYEKSKAGLDALMRRQLKKSGG